MGDSPNVVAAEETPVVAENAEKEILTLEEKLQQQFLDGSDGDYEFNYSGAEEEEEEIVEMTEDELLALLDKQQDPFKLCAKLFVEDEKIEQQEFKVVNKDTIRKLRNHGYVVVDGLAGSDLGKSIKEEALAGMESGMLKAASNVREDDIFRDGKARGDYIRWLHAEDVHDGNIGKYIQILMGDMLHDLSSVIHLNKTTPEMMITCYPGGGSLYERHRDSMPDGGAEVGQRRITVITYMNHDYKREDGGSLRVYVSRTDSAVDGKEFVDIEPSCGRTVIFLSGAVWHEVLPSFSSRVAVTAWYQ